MRRGLVLGIVLAAFSGGLAIILGFRSQATAPTPEPTASSAAAAPTDRLRIGAIVGTDARGEKLRAGLELAAKQLSEEWKQAPAVVLELRDPGGSAETAREELSKLRKAGVDLLAGFSDPELAKACAGPIRKGEVVLVSGGDAGVALSRYLGSGYFTVAPPAAPVGRELVELARRQAIEQLAVVYGPDQRRQAEAFRVLWGGLGPQRLIPLERAAQIPWAAKQLAKQGVQGVVLMLEPALAGALVAGAPKVGRWLGGPALGDPAFRKSAGRADLTRVAWAVPRRASGPEVEAARRRASSAWHAAHGEQPPPPEALAAYDALTLLARAARAARTDGRVDLKRLLVRLRAARHVGATGRIAFDGSGVRRPSPCELRTYTAERVAVPYQGER